VERWAESAGHLSEAKFDGELDDAYREAERIFADQGKVGMPMRPGTRSSFSRDRWAAGGHRQSDRPYRRSCSVGSVCALGGWRCVVSAALFGANAIAAGVIGAGIPVVGALKLGSITVHN
jgi:hypothetical protein